MAVGIHFTIGGKEMVITNDDIDGLVLETDNKRRICQC
jgi:hypothetical protein